MLTVHLSNHEKESVCCLVKYGVVRSVVVCVVYVVCGVCGVEWCRVEWCGVV